MSDASAYRIYTAKLSSAAQQVLTNPDSIYYGKEGHLRFARECKPALKEFTDKERMDFLKSSYGIIYVKGCHLKPLLDAKC